MRANLACVAALAVLAAGTALAEPAVTVDRGWVRGTPPGASVGAAYMAITNEGSDDIRLVGGDTPAAARVEIHQTEMAGGVMQMRPIAGGLLIAPGETAVLEPGANHMMLIDLAAPLEEGGKVPLTLDFGDAGALRVELPVAAIGAFGAPDAE